MSAGTTRRVTRTATGVYFTGSMVLPTAVGKVDLGLLGRALLTGMRARRLMPDGFWEVTSSNRLMRGPYTVILPTGPNDAVATCTCEAGQHGAPCTHVAVARFLTATLEPTA